MKMFLFFAFMFGLFYFIQGQGENVAATILAISLGWLAVIWMGLLKT